MPPKVMPGIAKVCANISILLTKELKELVKLAEMQHFQRAPPPAEHSSSSKEHEVQPQGVDASGEKERCIVLRAHRCRALPRALARRDRRAPRERGKCNRPRAELRGFAAVTRGCRYRMVGGAAGSGRLCAAGNSRSLRGRGQRGPLQARSTRDA